MYDVDQGRVVSIGGHEIHNHHHRDQHQVKEDQRRHRLLVGTHALEDNVNNKQHMVWIFRVDLIDEKKAPLAMKPYNLDMIIKTKPAGNQS